MRGHIQRRGKTSWRLKYELDSNPLTGKRRTHQVTVRGTKKDAERELARILNTIGEGTYVETTKITVGEYLERWLFSYADTSVSPKTSERWREIIEKHLFPEFGALPLRNLTPLHIQEYEIRALHSGRRDGKGGLAPRTVHHHHRVLHQALKHAVRWRMIARNPAEDIDPPKTEQTEIHTLNEADASVLLKATKPTRLHVPTVLALTTGMRRGEVLAVRWQDIDLDGANLTVNQSLEQTKRHGLRFKPPKSKKGRRRIALSPLTVAALRRQKVAQLEERISLGLGRNDDGLVFTTIEGETVNPRNFSKEFDRIVKRSGIERITFHALRHTHITQLLKDSENIKVVSERAGHASVAITLDIYGHVIPGMDENAALKVDAAWGAALQE